MRKSLARLTMAALIATAVPAVLAPTAALADDVAREAMAQATDGTAKLLFRPASADEWSEVEVPVADAVEVASDLARRGDVDVDRVRTIAAADPYYATYGWEQPLMDTDDVWRDGVDGSGVIVAVLDTGLFPTHPEYRDRVVKGYDAVAKRTLKPGTSSDDHGHGTWVTGTLGAARENGHGSTGTAPGVNIMPVDVFDGPYAHDSAIATGIRWAVDNGADVINMSLGGPGSTQVLAEAVDHAMTNGVVVIASAGNFSSGESEAAVNYPANDPDVIGVANSNSDDQWSGNSQSGPMVELSAPGSAVFSTSFPKADRAGWEAGGYTVWSGTSASAPVVSGVAALMIDAAGLQGRVTAPQAAMLRAALHDTAVDIGAAGHDTRTGHGRVDTDAAVAAFVDAVGTDDFQPAPKDDAPALDQASRTNVTAPRGQVEQRLARLDGRAAAADLAGDRFFAGHEAERVLLCRDDAFADCLAASAGVDDRTALLFTAGGPGVALSTETRTAVRDVLPAGGEVVILGGPKAVSYDAQARLDRDGFRTVRIAGSDRFDTAARVARHFHPDDTHVLVARGYDWADAIAGGSVASAKGMPVLLTHRDFVPDALATELARRGGNDVRVSILGGRAAVSADVAAQIDAIVGDVQRIAGADRVATSIAIAEQLHGIDGRDEGDQWVFARGHRDWQHALAGTMVSAVNDAPMLLVGGAAQTPTSLRSYLADVGGTGGSLLGPDIATHRATLASLMG